MEEKHVYEEFKASFLEEINIVKSQFSDYIFLCIGTNKVIGDSFGPFVGHILMKQLPHKKNIHVIGDMQKNVSYLNADYKIKEIYKKFQNPCIIAIDSALSKSKDIGKIIVTNHKIQLGKGIGKSEYEAGNIAIKGVVAKDHNKPSYNFFVLKNIPKKFVINLAKITANGICEVSSEIN